jgi:hypothetical protein
MSLRAPRPRHKCLAGTLQPPPAAEAFGKRLGRGTVSGDRREQGEHREAFAEADVLRVVDETNVPARRSAVELLQLLVSEQESQLERFSKADELKL